MPICTNCGTIHHIEGKHLCLPPIEKGYEYRLVYTKVQINEDGLAGEDLAPPCLEGVRVTREEYDAIIAARYLAENPPPEPIPLINGPEDLIPQ